MLGACADEPVELASLQQSLCAAGDSECTGYPHGTCPTVDDESPAGLRTYQCHLELKDLYGAPKSGQTVKLQARWCNVEGKSVLGTATGTTNAFGKADLSLTTTGANMMNCFVTTTNGIETGTGKTIIGGVFPSGEQIGTTAAPIQTTRYPDPTATTFPAGLVAGTARMDLYQAGSYDKVLIIVEPFDTYENFPSYNRDRVKYWRMLQDLLLSARIRGAGYDVWMFQPRNTGDNLHEQAAELAQAIKHAASTFAGAPRCGGNEVSVLGISTGGVVARLATARWEADAGWRTSLGLPATLPVNYVGTYDSPHYGMHINLPLQREMWMRSSGDDIHETTNLDSCAAAQLLRKRWDPTRYLYPGAPLPGAPTTDDFLAFWKDGAPVHYYSKQTGSTVTCAAGPAVATLNGNGWPATVRRVGVANSSDILSNTCFGDDRDNNAAGDNLCKFGSVLSSTFPGFEFAPSAGSNWLHVSVDDWADTYLSTEAADVESGSKNPLFMDGYGGSVDFLIWDFDYEYRQRFATTFISFKSAKGIQGPVGSDPYATVASPFTDENWANTIDPISHDVADLNNWLHLIGRLDASSICPVGPITRF